MKKSNAILEGIRVLDFTVHTAGPTCTAQLADLGAEVIKVEIPGYGDETRYHTPIVEGLGTQFMWNNRGKKSITVDMKDPCGTKILLELGKKVDLVVESLKPGSMKKMGLDYTEFEKVNPQIIYCSLSAFGQTGPKAAEPGFDIVAQAASGIMDLTGDTDGPPVKSGIFLSDFVSGKDTFGAIMAALFHKQRTGEGQYIDIAMLQCMTTMNPFIENACLGQYITRTGNHSASFAPYGIFRGPKNQHIAIGAFTPNHWSKFCKEALKRPELIDDPRFVDYPARLKNCGEIVSIVEDWLATFDSVDEAKNFLSAIPVVAGKVFSTKEVISDEHVLARKAVVDLPGTRKMAKGYRGRGSQFVFSKTPVIMKAPPELGDNNYEILSETGISRQEIYDLETKWGQEIDPA